MQVSTLRPGLLVSLKTSLSGNVHYATLDIERDHIGTAGERRARWETLRVIQDPSEHEEAVQLRGKCRSLIIAHCAPSSFGLLCPESSQESLDVAIAAARDIAAAFNRRAKLTRISVHVIAGRIASDDIEAVRAINSEVRDLLTAMDEGLQRLDAKAVREAADKARAIGAMLSPYAAEQVRKAIEVARSAARRIVKAGEEAAIEIDTATLRTIRQSRTAFLDMDDEFQGEDVERGVPATGRAVDLEPVPIVRAAVNAPSFNFDL